MPKTSIKKRNRLNRQRGKGFEYQVEKRLQQLGYKADRIYYSGAGEKMPYDIQVTFKPDDILQVEAKRTWKRGISLLMKWIEAIHDRHCIVFSIGPGSPGCLLKMYAVSQMAQAPVVATQKVKIGRTFKDRTVAMFLLPTRIDIDSNLINCKCFVITTNGQKSKFIKTSELMHQTVLEHKGTFYLIEDLHDYMKRTWSWKLENEKPKDPSLV